MSLSEGPGDAGAPIMSDNRGPFLTEITNQTDDVLNQAFNPVVLNPRRLVAQIVTAHIRRNHAMVPAEHRQLIPPRIPTFGKAMKQNDEVIAGTAFGIVEANLANICEPMLNSELALRLHRDHRDVWSSAFTRLFCQI